MRQEGGIKDCYPDVGRKEGMRRERREAGRRRGWRR